MCNTKKWWSVQHTLRYRNSTDKKKKKQCCIGSISADTQNFWYRIGIVSEKVVSSHPYRRLSVSSSLPNYVLGNELLGWSCFYKIDSIFYVFKIKILCNSMANILLSIKFVCSVANCTLFLSQVSVYLPSCSCYSAIPAAQQKPRKEPLSPPAYVPLCTDTSAECGATHTNSPPEPEGSAQQTPPVTRNTPSNIF